MSTNHAASRDLKDRKDEETVGGRKREGNYTRGQGPLGVKGEEYKGLILQKEDERGGGKGS